MKRARNLHFFEKSISTDHQFRNFLYMIAPKPGIFLTDHSSNLLNIRTHVMKINMLIQYK